MPTKTTATPKRRTSTSGRKPARPETPGRAAETAPRTTRREPIVEEMSHIIEDVWGLVDELLVQADLAAMDLRDGLKKRLGELRKDWATAKARGEQAVREAELRRHGKTT